jgi:hypothetical protein
MTTDRIIINPENNSFDGTAVSSNKKLIATEQIIREIICPDYLQSLVNIANKNYLRNFSLKLEIEYNDDDRDLIDQILCLNDEEFFRLVDIRLNGLLSKNQLKEREVVGEEEREYWTIEYLVDKLFLRIAGTKEIVNHKDKKVTIYKYYNQAFRLLNWISIANPTPEFIINVSDLTPRIVTELKALGNETYNYVIRQAVGRIFENIDSKQYHISIARKLKVRLDA